MAASPAAPRCSAGLLRGGRMPKETDTLADARESGVRISFPGNGWQRIVRLGGLA